MPSKNIKLADSFMTYILMIILMYICTIVCIYYNTVEGNDNNQQLSREMIVFYADWCGPCQLMKKEYEKDEFKIVLQNNNFKFYKMNIEDEKNKTFIDFYKVSSLPTIILRDSMRYEKYVGYRDLESLKSLINNYPNKITTNKIRWK